MITDYFKTVAETHISIAHSDAERKEAFFRVSTISQLEELLSNLRYVKSPFLVVQDDHEGGFETSSLDIIQRRRFFSFYILSKVKMNDHDGRQAAMDAAEDIGSDIIAKMQHDTRARTVNFDLSGQSFPVGPLGDNCFGIGFQFSVESRFCRTYDPAKFTSNP